MRKTVTTIAIFLTTLLSIILYPLENTYAVNCEIVSSKTITNSNIKTILDESGNTLYYSIIEITLPGSLDLNDSSNGVLIDGSEQYPYRRLAGSLGELDTFKTNNTFFYIDGERLYIRVTDTLKEDGSIIDLSFLSESSHRIEIQRNHTNFCGSDILDYIVDQSSRPTPLPTNTPTPTPTPTQLCQIDIIPEPQSLDVTVNTQFKGRIIFYDINYVQDELAKCYQVSCSPYLNYYVNGSTDNSLQKRIQWRDFKLSINEDLFQVYSVEFDIGSLNPEIIYKNELFRYIGLCYKEYSLNTTPDQIRISLTPTPTPEKIAHICDNIREDPNIEDQESILYGEKAKCIDCLEMGNAYTAFGCLPTSIEGFFSTVLFELGLKLAAAVAFLLMLWGSFSMLISKGDPQLIQRGREIIVSSVTGLLLIIFSVFIMQFFGYNVLRIPGFGGGSNTDAENNNSTPVPTIAVTQCESENIGNCFTSDRCRGMGREPLPLNQMGCENKAPDFAANICCLNPTPTPTTTPLPTITPSITPTQIPTSTPAPGETTCELYNRGECMGNDRCLASGKSNYGPLQCNFIDPSYICCK